MASIKFRTRENLGIQSQSSFQFQHVLKSVPPLCTAACCVPALPLEPLIKSAAWEFYTQTYIHNMQRRLISNFNDKLPAIFLPLIGSRRVTCEQRLQMRIQQGPASCRHSDRSGFGIAALWIPENYGLVQLFHDRFFTFSFPTHKHLLRLPSNALGISTMDCLKVGLSSAVPDVRRL